MFWFIRRRRHGEVSRRFTFHRELMVQRRDAPQVSLQPLDYDLEAAVIAVQRPSADPFDRPASSASRGSTQTTRQLDIELRIKNLQAQILELYNQPARAQDVEKMRRQVEWLQGQEDSNWALGLTDDRPPNYDLYMTT
ncbi:hypothetical protein BDZ94DRAFT_254242 [Collybia nuda]|uniref:Uncharacterized protein n=1 Tax=Collybia nuda TaxID=64659 RepID=A0A9P5XT86_9AGAR|nr:hypothetical protein BDZ94DRAFT_254242 [Collybia nuda]